ncbi:Hypothetical protein NTJ_09360 [Nesidiocoris tenuis]|uniref:Uncharacterized protein n=1 Tax=Nesidiocoris tenuis TaxID=355587 RepID=A0ABN7AWI2_9HEMI|nr:Hypothetical protein NTJ_09360 [Nesidiocoris tenuis]
MALAPVNAGSFCRRTIAHFCMTGARSQNGRRAEDGNCSWADLRRVDGKSTARGPASVDKVDELLPGGSTAALAPPGPF